VRPRDYLRRQQSRARRSLAQGRDRLAARLVGEPAASGVAAGELRHLVWCAGGVVLGLAVGLGCGAARRGAAAAARGVGRLARSALGTVLARALSG
jgi:hypothetical protein